MLDRRMDFDHLFSKPTSPYLSTSIARAPTLCPSASRVHLTVVRLLHFVNNNRFSFSRAGVREPQRYAREPDCAGERSLGGAASHRSTRGFGDARRLPQGPRGGGQPPPPPSKRGSEEARHRSVCGAGRHGDTGAHFPSWSDTVTWCLAGKAVNPCSPVQRQPWGVMKRDEGGGVTFLGGCGYANLVASERR